MVSNLQKYKIKVIDIFVKVIPILNDGLTLSYFQLTLGDNKLWNFSSSSVGLGSHRANSSIFITE